MKKHLDKLSTLPLNNAKIDEMIDGYFRDMDMVISELYRVTKYGGKCFFVVANSAWEGIYFETDKILSDMFIKYGFDVEEIRITRLKNNSAQQIKKFGKIKIRESIIVANKRSPWSLDRVWLLLCRLCASLVHPILRIGRGRQKGVRN